MAYNIHSCHAPPTYNLTQEQNHRSSATWNTTLPNICWEYFRHATKFFCFLVTCCCCCHGYPHDRPGVVVTSWNIWDYYIEDVPSPLPARRPRRLSESTPPRRGNIFKRAQKTREQSQSPLVKKLPLELREQIYALVLGHERVLHVVRRCASSISSVVCETSMIDGKTWPHRQCFGRSAWSDYNAPDQRLGNLLPLLLTCRKMSAFLPA